MFYGKCIITGAEYVEFLSQIMLPTYRFVDVFLRKIWHKLEREFEQTIP